VFALDRALIAARSAAKRRLVLARWNAALSVVPLGMIFVWFWGFALYSDFSSITMAAEDSRQVAFSVVSNGVPLLWILWLIGVGLSGALTSRPRSYAQAFKRFQQPDESLFFADDELMCVLQPRLNQLTHGWSKPSLELNSLD
jgi:hypothetical protein